MEFASVTVKPTTTALPSIGTQKAKNAEKVEDPSTQFFKAEKTPAEKET